MHAAFAISNLDIEDDLYVDNIGVRFPSMQRIAKIEAAGIIRVFKIPSWMFFVKSFVITKFKWW
jgi:hypothetical protein